MALPQSDSLNTGCAGCNRRSKPTRSDCSGRNPASQAELPALSTVYAMFIIGGCRGRPKVPASGPLCYDEVVWQRKAIRHGGSFLKHIIPAIIKPMHALWNEVIGFFFLCFATFFGIRTYTYFTHYAQAPPAAAPGEFMRVG